MADEDAIVEEVQAPVEEPQTEEAVPVEEVVSESVEEPVAEEALDEPVAEAVEPDPIPEPVELSREEVLERYADVFENERNKARQSRESELRRESATREETQRRVAELKQKLKESPDDDLDSLNFVYDNAEGNSRVKIMRELAKQAANAGWATEETAASLNATIEATSPEAIETYAAELVGIAVNHLGQRQTLELTADDIPADSPLAKSFAAREKSRVDAARKAATLEARPTREPEPVVGTGGVVGDSGNGNPLLMKLETEGRGALTVAEIAQAAQLLGVPVPD